MIIVLRSVDLKSHESPYFQLRKSHEVNQLHIQLHRTLSMMQNVLQKSAFAKCLRDNKSIFTRVSQVLYTEFAGQLSAAGERSEAMCNELSTANLAVFS